MPLDVLGRTRATLKESACTQFPGREALPGNPLNLLRARDRGLQLFPVNEEFPVSASHQLALITSLPFVHTARRYYRLNDRSEVFGPSRGRPSGRFCVRGKMTELGRLEEVKVVTRFP